jgi:hypothetical protein
MHSCLTPKARYIARSWPTEVAVRLVVKACCALKALKSVAAGGSPRHGRTQERSWAQGLDEGAKRVAEADRIRGGSRSLRQPFRWVSIPTAIRFAFGAFLFFSSFAGAAGAAFQLYVFMLSGCCSFGSLTSTMASTRFSLAQEYCISKLANSLRSPAFTSETAQNSNPLRFQYKTL